jgi:hypothetical protein
MKAYKLFRVRKDGSLGSLYINRRARYTPGYWYHFEEVPTKGFGWRPGFHALPQPEASWINEKEERVWYHVELKRVTVHLTHKGEWYTAEEMKVLKPVEN